MFVAYLWKASSGDLAGVVCSGLEKRFRVICLNDNIPTMLAYADDLSYEDVFLEQLKNFFRVGDVVMGISGSGNSKNVLKAVSYAARNRGKTIGLCGFQGGELAKIVDIPLIVRSDDMQKVEDVHMVVVHMLMQKIGTHLYVSHARAAQALAPREGAPVRSSGPTPVK